MREIKFRAWNTKAKKYETGWCYPSQHLDPGFAPELPDGIILMQYTGLKDKNGKEIYEGDIVSYYYGSQDPKNWVVVWGYDQWEMENGDRTVGDDNAHDDPHWTNWEHDVEVIGNIYENPELLSAAPAQAA